MTTRTGNYMIYKMYSKELDNYTTVFFIPDDTFKRVAYRLLTLADYKERGYQVAGILYVDKEAYLNARLADTVEDYLYEDRLERETKQKFRSGQMDRDVYLDTMRMIQDYKWTCLKKIDMQIRRMVREDFTIENEIALALYDEYLSLVL